MKINIIEYLFSTRIGKYLLSAYIVFNLIWSIAEPLNIQWINNNKELWRVLIIGCSLVLAILLTIKVISKTLEIISASGTGRNLQDSYWTTGAPQIHITQDGVVGNVMNITGNYHNDHMDWQISMSGQYANHLELIFKHRNVFYFYLLIEMKSRNGADISSRWIRFDNTIPATSVYHNDPHEMAIKYESTSEGNFIKTNIDIGEAVKQTYGQGGWVFKRIVTFRIRCNDGVVKSVAFKK